ncbi:MAG: diacylglycerol kinase [Gemmatimonadota bacterium]|nr:diacylglycerol kinase [Gemmatimonadota bacterium]
MIPAFVNDAAGTASAGKQALEDVGGFEVHAMPPDGLEAAIREAMKGEPKRILIAGGDGSVGTAARVVCGTSTQLAVLPGGTLNHFARDHDIPTDLDEAASVAANGREAEADVAYVKDRLFLNTSSVGAYVAYVRLRDRMEKYLGYRVASFVAAIRLYFSLRPVSLELDVDGERKQYSTPVVFIGVGERETKSPVLGNRVKGGRHCLHVIVLKERRAARLLAVALDAARRGLTQVAATPELDSFMVDSCVITTHHSHHVAVDGEIVKLGSRLEYRIDKGALKIVVPHPTDAPTA